GLQVGWCHGPGRQLIATDRQNRDGWGSCLEPRRYLSFFSRFPSMSNSCFWPPNSAAPFPLSLSPSIVSLYSTVISLSMSFRTAENVSVPSFSFRSLRLVSFWSGQLIVPASLSPSFLIVKVDVRFCPPISYSHFHVPTGSALSAAPARP